MNRRTRIFLPLIIAISIAMGIFLGTSLNYQKKTITFFGGTPQERKIKRLIDYIQYEYVDEVDTDSLLDGTIKHMLDKLDPHSVYISARELEGVSESMNGKFVGIGIQFRMYRDSLTVVKVLDKGPSEKAGIKAGDRILIADNDTLYGKQINSDYILKTLKGKPDTSVDLIIYRKSEDELLPFTIVRGEVPINSVDAHYMLSEDLGYIKINKFAATTYQEFKVALNDLLDKGMKKLVLDLRHNPGGYLQVATQIIDEFLEDGKLIVFTKNKKGRIDETFATSKGDFEDGHVFVLINGASASASEIVAGALQDNDKGTIVGRRSFGKGLVQQEMQLGDGSAVRLTVSRYYTPTGRSIQKPYENKGNGEYFNDFEQRYHGGELMNADSIKVNDSLKYETPKGKIVYGGGGIIPDIFVPIDTTMFFPDFHYQRSRQFVFQYLDTHVDEFEGWSFDTLMSDFDKDKHIFNEYMSEIPSEFQSFTGEEEKNFRLYLKALFAQQIFDINAYFRIVNEQDMMIRKVIELHDEGYPIDP
ncbi:S41 family peptidase [Lutimonas vermicola]|uniref:S41 family peptidase n=1 Tax=Lutimonas vermicola TaxID=414288 RepID=A0ABU9L2Q5_9FLAO